MKKSCTSHAILSLLWRHTYSSSAGDVKQGILFLFREVVVVTIKSANNEQAAQVGTVATILSCYTPATLVCP